MCGNSYKTQNIHVNHSTVSKNTYITGFQGLFRPQTLTDLPTTNA